MPPYTVVNLLEIEETVSDRAPGIEGRFGRKHIQSRDLGVSHWRYAPNKRAQASHTHDVQEEVYVVLGGSGRVRVDDEVVDVKPWDLVRVAPGVVRAVEAGPEGIEFLAIGGPRPEEGDGRLVQDEWPEG